MQTRLSNRFSEEQKAQVVKECIETNNYAAVSSKHDIPVTTIYGWIRRHKNKQKKESRRNVKELEAELKDVKLENEILKELLKKSHQLWLKD
ncbi:MAG: transposase [Deltaproteobacteria bacterium]|nr:transposase [Deltaproteobacteria bacterium]